MPSAKGQFLLIFDAELTTHCVVVVGAGTTGRRDIEAGQVAAGCAPVTNRARHVRMLSERPMPSISRTLVRRTIVRYGPHMQASFDDLGTPLDQVTFVVVDLETTGGSAADGGITEIGAVKLQGGQQLGTFCTFVNPGCAIPRQITLLTGITQAMVAGQPTFAEVADDLDELLTGAVLVAHNAPFDVSFLSAEYARIGRVMPAVPVLCTLKLARRHFKFPSNKLGSIAEALGVGQSVAHRALADTAALGGIFSHFLAEFEKKGVKTLEQLLVL